jgi:glycerol-3-phosphate dehydrogenase
VQADRLAAPTTRRLRLVRGSHVVVPRLHAGGHAYILQQPDRRVVFVLPFGDDASVLGTTEVVVDRPGPARMDAAECAYLCEAAARFLREPPTPRDVLASWSGVRPLLDDGRASASAVTRDYALDLDAAGAPLLSVWGGKLTTCRRLAERALDLLAPHLPATRGAWTAAASLPGGNLPAGRDADARAAAEAEGLRQSAHGLPTALAAALVSRHGTRARDLLASGGPGPELAPGLHAAELDWCVRHEWALTTDDVLWRRSKAGLRATPAQRRAVESRLNALIPPAS